MNSAANVPDVSPCGIIDGLLETLHKQDYFRRREKFPLSRIRISQSDSRRTKDKEQMWSKKYLPEMSKRVGNIDKNRRTLRGQHAEDGQRQTANVVLSQLNAIGHFFFAAAVV